MNMDRTKKILSNHNIEYAELVSKTTGEVRLLVYEIATQRINDTVVNASKWIDITDYNVEELFSWLGY